VWQTLWRYWLRSGFAHGPFWLSARGDVYRRSSKCHGESATDDEFHLASALMNRWRPQDEALSPVLIYSVEFTDPATLWQDEVAALGLSSRVESLLLWNWNTLSFLPWSTRVTQWMSMWSLSISVTLPTERPRGSSLSSAPLRASLSPGLLSLYSSLNIQAPNSGRGFALCIFYVLHAHFSLKTRPEASFTQKSVENFSPGRSHAVIELCEPTGDVMYKYKYMWYCYETQGR